MELDCDATNSKAKKNIITSNASIKGQLGQAANVEHEGQTKVIIFIENSFQEMSSMFLAEFFEYFNASKLLMLKKARNILIKSAPNNLNLCLASSKKTDSRKTRPINLLFYVTSLEKKLMRFF